MTTTFRLNANDLSEKVMNAIKVAFQNKEIEIIIAEVMDDTDYLLSSKENTDHLLKSLQEIEERKAITMIVEELIEK